MDYFEDFSDNTFEFDGWVETDSIYTGFAPQWYDTLDWIVMLPEVGEDWYDL